MDLSNGCTWWAARNWWFEIARSVVMNCKILIGLVVLLAVNSLLLADQPAYKSGVVLVRFANEPNTTAKSTILKSALGASGSSVKRDYTLVKGLSQVSLPTGVSVESAVASLKQSSSVLYAGPDYISHTFVVPSDARFSELWGMRNTGQAGGTSGADINATAAWDISTGSSSIVVAVTDTGVDYTHSDLAANMWTDANGHYGYDFVNSDNDPMDDYGHGTHVAGIIGAVGDNSVGVAGVCWHVKIMAVKIFDANGEGYLSDMVSGVQYAVSSGAKVINASWGFDPGVSLSDVQSLYDAISAARDVNVIFVAAAGNDYGNNNDASPVYPASFDLDNVISVMATTDTDQMASYSNYGLTSVDLGAPGGSNSGGSDDILSTYPGGGYAYKAGTSMASPHVAGACALLLSIDSTLKSSQVKEIVLDTVDLTLPGLCVSGGRLNLAAAAEEASMDSTSPTPSTAGWLVPPVATGLHTIAMEAQNEIDRSGVQYYFECVNDTSINSGWEPNAIYVFKDPCEVNIEHGQTYGFRVKARDKSANHNETAWSNTLYATTAAVTDNLPPAPSPAQWAMQPILIRPSPLILRMKIKGKGTDENGEMFRYKYNDINTPGTVIDSGWVSSTDGTMPNITSGITLGHTYVFNCKVKDTLGNETGWSEPNVSITLTTVTGSRILHVPAEYLTIQAAINAANNGDIVEVSPYPVSPYYYQGINLNNMTGNINLRFYGKAITVRSTDPEDPNVVARTIIDCNGTHDANEPRRAFIFDNGETASSILAGFTIRNAYVKGHQGRDGDIEDVNGGFGRTAAGGAILCGPSPDPCNVIELGNWGTLPGSPTIRNCVFINCVVEGGDGGNGADGNDGNDYVAEANDEGTITPALPATPGCSGGDGNTSGSGLGGAIYCSPGSNPVIKNCDILNCYALSGVPGNGGDGGAGGNDPNTGQEAGGNAGWGGDVNYFGAAGGGICVDKGGVGSNPQIIGCDINDCNAHVVTSYGLEGQPGAGNPLGQIAYGGDFGYAFGGGVYYAGLNAAVNISSTTFARDRSQADPEWGIYKNALGGGICLDVYGTAITTMTDCDFNGNSADTRGGGIYYWGSGAGAGLTLQNCEVTDNNSTVDGGGLAGLFYSGDTFEAYNSDIRGNIAGAGDSTGYGGGFYLGFPYPFASSATATIEDCNFEDNQAQEGGALIALNCQVDILGCNITGNAAVTSSGIGGGLVLWNSTGLVTDCIMNGNRADGYGGAAFVEGFATAPLQFINCLITDNTAVYDGGGLSNKSWAWTELINCTLVNNSSTDETYGSGGGVSCEEFWAWVEIYNSILWDNTAAYGPQIGVGSKFGYSSDPGGYYANVDVYYSDVEGGAGQAFIEDSAYMAVWWMDGSFDADPLFVNIDINQSSYYLSQATAGQLEPNSPCVDAGYPAFIDVNWLETLVGTLLTTRTDLVEDAGIVDIGYHYTAGTAPKYSLTIKVVGDVGGSLSAQGGGGDTFTVEAPYTRLVSAGTVVSLQALADAGYSILSWSGTDNDASINPSNTVTMNSDKVVRVQFHQYILTIEVNGIGGYEPNGTLVATGDGVNPFTLKTRQDPNSRGVTPGTVVDLNAFPDDSFRVMAWSGTDNDTSTARTNTVTMNSDVNVIVTFEPNGLYYLTVTVVDSNGTVVDINGVTLIGRTLHVSGEAVTLTATPTTSPTDTVVWTGTDNDNSDGKTNTVTMTGHRNVTVEFYTPRVLYVGGSSEYSTLQTAIDDANDRDIIILMPSSQPYYTQAGYTISGKDITITSTNPDDPTVVASTIIEQKASDSGYVSPAFVLYNVGPLMRLQGITIKSFYGDGGTSDDGDPSYDYYDGLPGSDVPAMGIWCYYNASPTIKNCVIDDCHTSGGNGGNGASGDSDHPNGGNGGWPGGALGSALNCYYYSSPTIINCTFSNNAAIGGNGGAGGNGSSDPYGRGGRGGGWYYGYEPPSPWEWTPPVDIYDLPKNYSGLGGAVYIGYGCSPTFESCAFTNNFSSGGINGICGEDGVGGIDEPSINYKIDSLGGAVYVAEGGYADFNNCTFTSNTADTNKTPDSYDGFVGYGGAVAADTYGTAIFNKCDFSSNISDIGGGLYAVLAYSEVDDCNFSGNNATHGGGLLLTNSVAYITGSTFISNVGVISGSDGGAIALLGSNAEVADCNISDNQVGGSGGGIYISSKNVDGNEIDGDNYVLVKNCLITGNAAYLDGGGISANWYSEPNIVNCTIYNNKVSSGLGGGLFGSYGSYVNVLNSIIWDNQAGVGASGSQIALSGGESPATIQVHYSDVQDSNDPCAWTSDINALDFVICFDTTGSMDEDINAVKTAAKQITNSIAAKFADYRLALVDYRDYPDGSYGSTSDWAYLDRVRFTTDTDELITGLQLMTVGNGIDISEAGYTALMHCIDANALEVRLTANGYAEYIDVNSPGPGEWRKGDNVMRVILVLTDANMHDPENYTNYVLSDIVTAANGENPIHIIPVIIRNTEPEDAWRPVAIETGGTLISVTDSNAVPSAVLNVIDLLSQVPAPIYVESGGTINWDSTTFTWDSNSHNINADPLFIDGFFLSQIDAGQPITSPCVDAGSGDINNLDINFIGYTTRTDGVQDVGVVDMGYHYPIFVPVQYTLSFTAVEGGGVTPTIVKPTSRTFNWYETVQLEVNGLPDGYQVLWTGTDNNDICDVNNTVLMNEDRTVTVTFVRNICDLTVSWNDGGTVTPVSGTYARGTSVTLTATPDSGYRIESWEGTDDDDSYAKTNIVTMNGDKTVTVTFSVPQTRTVPGDYTTIQEAIEAARSGDIVSVASGVYHGSTIVLNKEITLSSTNPDDPCVVAATIIDSNGYEGGMALLFTSGATSNTVVDGFTITSGTYEIIASDDASNAGQNGPDGGGIAGGAVYVYAGASPTIRNCVIRDTSITGGNAGSGGSADSTSATPAGRGGWGGWARGGGIYIAPFANPTLVNCTITNCTVTGGTGGNGGDSTGEYGDSYQDANHGGLWSNDFSFPWRSMVGADGEPCYIGDYRYYSGYGGGVFCDANSEANFIGCYITNNTASGGMSGIGGSRPSGAFIPDPITAYRIPSYGGGVYCGENSDINFVSCTISGNIAPRPDSTYHTDPYLGHGGGIAFENTANIRFEDCIISDNNSAAGGGMFWSGGEPQVLDSYIMRNTAYIGGGIYAMESAGQVKGCTISSNYSGTSSGDVDSVAGQGGGIFGSSIDTTIIDCVLTGNNSSTSGGGIHIYGLGDANTIIWNCLLTGNQAGRDGGGISANWGAAVSVENCTLYGNAATGTYGISGSTGYGGGLYCSYEAQANVKNSIFWDNNGIYGKEIAEGIGFVESGTTDKYYCGTVAVSYSDVNGGESGVLVSDGCPLVWGVGNMSTDPYFVDADSSDFHLKQITAGQTVDSNCVNAGGDLAVSLGLFKYTTSTLGTSDTGIVDLGYHYTIAGYCRKWDLYVDDFINFRDFAVFASSWVGDLDDDGYGIDDLKEFTYCWLEELAEDANAPMPNPMTWATAPYALTSSSVAMVATTAVDSSGQVYYQFEEVGGSASAWQTSTYYVATGISSTGEYCFKVRARDKYNNTTAWSEPACVSDIGDVNSPTPAPTFIAVAAENITRDDANTASGQFEWDPANYQFDWWHRVIVDVTDVADDITSTSELEVRFICSSSAYSSENVIPAAYRPIRIGYPVAIGGRIPDGSGAASGSYRLTWDTTSISGQTLIVYEVYVEQSGGSYGKQLSWHVCVYDEAGNSACTDANTIPQ